MNNIYIVLRIIFLIIISIPIAIYVIIRTKINNYKKKCGTGK